MTYSSFQLVKFESVYQIYGGKTALHNISFTISRGERIALLGENGCGKSTLAKLLVGLERPTEGKVTVAAHIQLGYLPQESDIKEGMTLEGDLFEWRAQFYLMKMGLSWITSEYPLHQLSGGEKRRFLLAMLLLQEPDLLVLDEPTNHLDHEVLEWLEVFLKEYRGAILLISHDRAFLNRVANGIFELTTELKYYSGNYDDYLREKGAERQRAIDRYEQIEQKERVLKKVLKKQQVQGKIVARSDNNKMGYDHKGGKVQKQKARIIARAKDQLEELQEKKPRLEKEQEIRILFHPEPSLSILFEDENLGTISSGDRLILLGKNGSGKSTLLKQIKEKVGRVGYLDQEGAVSDQELTLVAYLEKRFTATSPEELVKQLHQIGLLEQMQWKKKVAELSIGQRRRLQLVELILSRANLLLLDEPTNHLAPYVIDALEEALCQFPGGMIIVTHDRQFMKKVGTRFKKID